MRQRTGAAECGAYIIGFFAGFDAKPCYESVQRKACVSGYGKAETVKNKAGIGSILPALTCDDERVL